MYEALLQSADRPFRATPDTKFYYPSDSIEQARQTVVRAIMRAEGPCLVLGGAGLGKTMLGQVIADDVYGRFDIVKLHATGLCSRRALLQSILFELHLPYRDLSEGELRMSIMDRLSPSPETAPSGILMIVDEAHTLSPKLLEELRLITNFARNGQPRARLVLLGNMRLEDTFANPQLDSFNQRLAARCYLQPMTRDQSMEFVRHQLRCAQVEPATLITNDAMRTLYAASEGVPRLVNQVMDHALVLGITSGQCPISASLIEEAWSDLQQLPAPWHTSNAPEKSSVAISTSTIEFGELSDDDEESFVESTANNSEQTISSKGSTKAATTGLRIDTSVDSPSYAAAAKANSPINYTSKISVTTARYVYPAVESDTEASEVDDEYSLANDSNESDPLNVIANGPKQNFFAAFAPVVSMDTYRVSAGSIDSNQEDADDELELSPEDQLVSEIKQSERETLPERVVFDASKAFGLNRHQANYPRGTEPVAQATRPIVEPFNKPSIDKLVARQPAGIQAASSQSSKNAESTVAYETTLNATNEVPDSSRPLAAGFFGSHPSDIDMLDFETTTDAIIASSEETESVWENDPPIYETKLQAKQQTAIQNASDRKQVADASAKNLFGEDFEEEISIAMKGGVGKDRRIFEPKPLDVVAALPLSARHAAAEEQLTAMENQRLELDDARPYEDASQARKFATNGMATEKPAAMAPEGLAPETMTPESIVASWTVDVAATEAEREIALHSEIEDLVSQLNFSAFAVEPYSVEQIAVEYQRDAAVSKHRQANSASNISREDRETIYTLHTADANEMDEDIHSNLTMDDDRDLLVIEEELPVSSRMAAEQLEAPVVKAPSYSQLFAKLRH